MRCCEILRVNLHSTMRVSCELLHVLLVSFAVLLYPAAGQGGVRPVNGDGDGVCEPITSQICANIGYDNVFVPNARGHETQTAAETEIGDFVQLIQRGCSDALYVFLCSYYFPLCFIDPSTSMATKVKTCRSLCIFVRSACEPTLNSLANLPWPTFLNCSLDDFSDDPSCFGPAVLTNLSIPSSESPPISATPVLILSDPTPSATPSVVSVNPTPAPQTPPSDLGTTDRTTTNSARMLNAKALINGVLFFMTITLVVVLICNRLV